MGCLVSRSEASSPQKVDRALQPVSGPLHAMPQHPPRTSLFPTFQTSSQPSPSTTAHAAAAPPAYRSPAQPAIELVQSGSSRAKLCCDKCDGTHATDACPHYKKKREDHPDGKSPPLTHFHTRPSMRVAKCAVHPYHTHFRCTRLRQISLCSCARDHWVTHLPQLGATSVASRRTWAVTAATLS